MGWYFQVYFLEGVRFPPKFEMADFLAWTLPKWNNKQNIKFAGNLKFRKQGQLLLNEILRMNSLQIAVPFACELQIPELWDIFAQMGHTQGSWCFQCAPLTRGKHVLPVTSSTIQVIITTMTSQNCIAVTNTAPWQFFIITVGIIILAEYVTILIWSTAWLIVYGSLRKKRTLIFFLTSQRKANILT